MKGAFEKNVSTGTYRSDVEEKTLANRIGRTSEAILDAKLYAVYKRTANKHYERHDKSKAKAIASNKQDLKQRMEDKVRGMKVMSRTLNKPKARPLLAVERIRANSSIGMLKGTVATTPQEIDAIVREKWKKGV